MSLVPMIGASKEFKQCWQAAGRHLEDQAPDGIDGWIRAHLAPPFLEHLSFRLGNQLFFIRLVDADRLIETPGNEQGLMEIAKGCNGHACLMPMQCIDDHWQPVEDGWGLVDAVTGALVDPPSLVTDEKIEMTEWELQVFGIQVVRQHLEDEGRTIMSWNNNPDLQPSLWFVGDEGPEWVIVTVALLEEEMPPPPADIDDLQAGFNKTNSPGNFAVVSIATLGDLFDFDDESDDFSDDEGIDMGDEEFDAGERLYRGQPMDAFCEGLERVYDPQ